MKLTEFTPPPPTATNGLQQLDLHDWDDVHEVVQSALKALDEKVRQLFPGVRISSGRNQARAWDSFSYRVYAPGPESDIDPVDVGLMFTPGVIISSDICGETLGDVLFEIEEKSAIGKQAILNAAQQCAQELTRHGEVIASALQNSRRKV
jgi:hypothetical protein